MKKNENFFAYFETTFSPSVWYGLSTIGSKATWAKRVYLVNQVLTKEEFVILQPLIINPYFEGYISKEEFEKLNPKGKVS